MKHTLSAFVLIKLMKIKQSLALSIRCSLLFFVNLWQCWALLPPVPFAYIHPFQKVSRCPQGSLVSWTCHRVYFTPGDGTCHYLFLPAAVLWEPPNLPHPLPLK